MGLLGLPFAESDGGLGGGPVDTMIVMEAFGRGLVLEPYLATIVLGGGVLRAAAQATQQRESLIPAIIGGELLLAFAHREDAVPLRPGRRADDSPARRQAMDLERQEALRAARRFGAEAHRIGAHLRGVGVIVTVLALFLVDAQTAGVRRRGYLTQDRLRAADIELDNVRVEAEDVIGEPGSALPVIERVTDEAIAALCAEAVGCMAQAHELTVDYLKSRKQFGVAIGSFQALQHRAVDMLVLIEQARSMALFATMMAAEKNPEERGKCISAAKVQIGKSAQFVGQQAVQLHGGIGVTEECQAGHYFRRLSMIEVLFGDTDHHLASLSRSSGLLSA